MKRFVLSLLILAGCLSGFSQKIYFLYLQSENEQPFFLKLNERIHSSTASGYLLLSRLHDSSYTFTIGFPQNKFPEQKFTIDMKGKDRGYQLRNFAEKGWGLFDLQTLTIQMALADSKKIKTEPRTDLTPFTEILARAANDPSLRERAIVVKMEEKPVVPQAAVVKETVSPPQVDTQSVVKKEDKPKTAQSLANKTEPVVVKQDTQVSKRSESITKQTESPAVQTKDPAKEPVRSTVAVKDESKVVKEGTDTKKEDPVAKKEEPVVVKKEEPVAKKEEPVVVKKEESVVKKEETKEVPAEYKRSTVTRKSESSTSEGLGLMFIDELSDGKKDTIRIIIPNPRNSPSQLKENSPGEKKFLDISTSDSAKPLGSQKKESAVVRQPKMTNSNCKTLASETDLSKLQKKMIGEKNDEDMIGEARKVFKNRCFTTGQLKSLSALFLNDAGKYKFFDAAYTYAADTENFSLLSSELKDEYYINRFKAMLR